MMDWTEGVEIVIDYQLFTSPVYRLVAPMSPRGFWVNFADFAVATTVTPRFERCGMYALPHSTRTTPYWFGREAQ